MNEDDADDKMLVFAMILITLIKSMSMKIFMIIELDHVCHVLGACESERLNCVADVGGWTLSKRTSGLDLDEDDRDQCKNCVLIIMMI